MIKRVTVVISISITVLFAFISCSGCGDAGDISVYERIYHLDWVTEPSAGVDSYNPQSEEDVDIYFKLNHEADVTAEISDSASQVVKTLDNGDGRDNTCFWETGCSWDGKDAEGQYVPAGIYHIDISGSCEEQCSSRWETTSIEYTIDLTVVN